MRLEAVKVGSVMVVEPKERRIDAAAAAAFKASLIDLILGGERRIVIDLAAVDFIDSTGLGAIVSTLKALGQEGELAICNPRETVMNLFRLTRMNRVFEILSSREEAVASLNKK